MLKSEKVKLNPADLECQFLGLLFVNERETFSLWSRGYLCSTFSLFPFSRSQRRDLHQIRLLFCRELSAGGVDITSARAANVSRNAARFEHRFEPLDLPRVGRMIIKLLGRIVRDQVYFYAV